MISIAAPSVDHDFSSSSARSVPLLLMSFMGLLLHLLPSKRTARRILTSLLRAEETASTQSVRTRAVNADSTWPRTKCYRSPTAWFLPGPECMRGGAARRFASDRHFHRGSQAESTCPMTSGKATHYQRLAESRSWRAGFFAESTESSLRKPPRRKPASGSHLQGSH